MDIGKSKNFLIRQTRAVGGQATMLSQDFSTHMWPPRILESTQEAESFGLDKTWRVWIP